MVYISLASVKVGLSVLLDLSLYLSETFRVSLSNSPNFCSDFMLGLKKEYIYGDL